MELGRLAAERRRVVEFCRRMVADGLVVGTSGNVSVRRGELVAVSPSGLPYDVLTPEQVAVVGLDGAVVEAPPAPTSELPMHLAIYAGTDAGAVIHTHATAATAVSTLVETLPSVHYLVGLFGGPVRVAPYRPYGTPELAAATAAALRDRTGCLLQNHGAVTIGADPEQAYTRAVYLEWLCEVWLRARSVGTPQVLDDAEIERAARRLSAYGIKPVPGARPDPA